VRYRICLRPGGQITVLKQDCFEIRRFGDRMTFRRLDRQDSMLHLAQL
jgi:hypothetical protein